MNGTAHQRQPGTHKIKRPERDDGDRSVHIVDIHIHCLEYGPQLTWRWYVICCILSGCIFVNKPNTYLLFRT